jgi:hypothetical protein
MMISSVGWSIAVTNVGTIYRHRAQILFVPLILIASDQVRRRAARMARPAGSLQLSPVEAPRQPIPESTG